MTTAGKPSLEDLPIGVPYGRQVELHGTYKVCPRCGELVALVHRKDFESWDTTPYAQHWAEAHPEYFEPKVEATLVVTDGELVCSICGTATDNVWEDNVSWKYAVDIWGDGTIRLLHVDSYGEDAGPPHSLECEHHPVLVHDDTVDYC